jgi:hypothetical protein
MKRIGTLLTAFTLSSPLAFAIGPTAGLPPLDLTVVGPGNEKLMYYKDGNDIVVKNCGKGYAVIEKRSDCEIVGQENRVPVEAFKRVLKAGFLFNDADKLKPLTRDELEAYRKSSPPQIDHLKQRERELDTKLAQIRVFIQKYGKDDKTGSDSDETTKLLADVRKELASTGLGEQATKKVNALINELVDKKIASTEMSSTSLAQAGDQATYTLLKQFDASRAECGTDEILNGERPGPSTPNAAPAAGKGAWLESILISKALAADPITLEQRIKDCAALPGSLKRTKAGVAWNLVARRRDRATGAFSEVWKDSKSGLVWGDNLRSTYTHYNAVALDLKGQVSQEKACVGEEGKQAVAGVTGKSFGLPKIEEFEQAEKNGIREALPNMNHWFWSASLYAYSQDGARGFYGYSGASYVVFRGVDFSVRCVGR